MSAEQGESRGVLPEVPVVIVAGFSGAGLSTALHVFEDLRFVTADGLPPAVLPDMAHLLRAEAVGELRGVALGVRLPHRRACEELLASLRQIAEDGDRPLLLFLTAEPAEILRRYATTRRPHPLERDGVGLEQALIEEVTQLAPIREAADSLIDTTAYSIHDLRRVIQRRWRKGGEHQRALTVHLITFGFKYGVPREADLVFDLRFLPNPYFDEALRPLSGRDQAVVDAVFSGPAQQEFKRRFLDFLSFLLPYYESEGRYRLSIAVGCTGGRHRSVAMAEAVAACLKKQDYAVSIEHRHMALG